MSNEISIKVMFLCQVNSDLRAGEWSRGQQWTIYQKNGDMLQGMKIVVGQWRQPLIVIHGNNDITWYEIIWLVWALILMTAVIMKSGWTYWQQNTDFICCELILPFHLILFVWIFWLRRYAIKRLHPLHQCSRGPSIKWISAQNALQWPLMYHVF